MLASRPLSSLAASTDTRMALVIRDDQQLNATRAQMIRAIDDFGRSIARPDCEVALFYYAGHAAQFDWRNFLLPVDGDVEARQRV